MPKTFTFEDAAPKTFGWEDAQPEQTEPASYQPETPPPIPPPAELRPATMMERYRGAATMGELGRQYGGGADVSPRDLMDTAFKFASVPPPLAKPIEKVTDIPINLLPPVAAGAVQGVRDLALQLPIAAGAVSMGKAAGRAMLALFSGEFLAQAPEAYEQYKALRAQGRNQEASRLLVSQVGTALLLGAGAKIDQNIRAGGKVSPTRRALANDVLELDAAVPGTLDAAKGLIERPVPETQRQAAPAPMVAAAPPKQPEQPAPEGLATVPPADLLAPAREAVTTAGQAPAEARALPAVASSEASARAQAAVEAGRTRVEAAPEPAASATQPERVVAAAVRINGQLVTGSDHAGAIEKYAKEHGFDFDETFMEKHGQVDSGFLTDTGRFIDLDEAARISGKPGQVAHAAEIIKEPIAAPAAQPKEPNAPETRIIEEGREPEHPGTAPGTAVSPDVAEAREGEGRPAGGGNRPVGVPEEKEPVVLKPSAINKKFRQVFDATDEQTKLDVFSDMGFEYTDEGRLFETDRDNKKYYLTGQQLLDAKQEFMRQVEERKTEPTPPTPEAAAKEPIKSVDVKEGDTIRWEPNERERRYQGPVDGIVQDVIHNSEGDIGFNIFSPTEGDPSRVVRVWANRGTVVSRTPVAVESKGGATELGVGKATTTGEIGTETGAGRTPPRPKTVVEIADEIAARGIDPQASYGQFVKARNLKPEIDASEWLPIYRRSLELARLNKEIALSKKSPAAKPAEGEMATSTPSQVASAASRFRPREQVVFENPLAGPSGAKLTAYEWKWQPEEYVDKYGEERKRRVSNWEEAQTSGDTGRDIVHQFLVEMPNGEKRLVSAESVPVLLGFTERGKASRLPSLVSATKTLAKLRMQLATAKAQLDQYNKAVESASKLTLPEVTSEPAIYGVGRESGRRYGTTWKMGDASVLQHDTEPIRQERMDTLIDAWRRKRVEEMGAKQPYVNIRDLENRIERQNRKISDITTKSPTPAPAAETGGGKTSFWDTYSDAELRMYNARALENAPSNAALLAQRATAHFILAKRIKDGKSKYNLASVLKTAEQELRNAKASKSAPASAEAIAEAERTKQSLSPISGNIGAGPGAAGAGWVDTAIARLKEGIEGLPKSDARQKLAWADRWAEREARGRDLADRAVLKAEALNQSMKESMRGVRTPTDLGRKVGELDYLLQRSSALSHQTTEAMRKQMPSEDVRAGLWLYADAHGDLAAIRDTIATMPADTPANVRRALNAALTLTPKEKAWLPYIRDFYDRRAGEAQASGVINSVLDDYFTHIWRVKDNMPPALQGALNRGAISEYFQFARERKLPIILEGIKNPTMIPGKRLEPVLDAAKVVPFYNHAMDRAMASREFIKSLSDLKASDGRPLVASSGVRIEVKPGSTSTGALLIKPELIPEKLKGYEPIDHPAMRKWRWAGEDAAGNPILYEGDLVVHPEAYQRLARMLDRSRLTPSKVTTAALKYSGEIKAAKLGMLSTFHLVHVGKHAIFHWTNPFAAATKPIQWESPQVRFAVEQGHLKLAPEPGEINNLSEGLGAAGDMLIHKIPLLGPVSKAFSEWMFREYIPRLKLHTFENVFERNMRMYGPGRTGLGKAAAFGAKELTREEVAARSGDAVNAAYGELNKYWLGKFGRDPRMQRALRLVFLAPDFGEARLRFVGKAFTKYGNEERLALALNAIMVYTAARIGNYLSTGDPQMDDPRHAFEVKTGDHWTSMRSVIADLAHAMTNFSQFMRVRMNPALVEPLIEMLSKTNMRGQPVDATGQMKDMLKRLVPIPLQGMTESDRHIWESFSGSMGFSTRKGDAVSTMHQLAANWKKDRGIQSPVVIHESPVGNPYREARIGLEQDDEKKFWRAAIEQYQRLKLQGNKAPAKTIEQAFTRYYKLPFTGNQGMEKSFRAELPARDRIVYDEALKQQKESAKKFKLWWKDYPKAFAGL